MSGTSLDTSQTSYLNPRVCTTIIIPFIFVQVVCFVTVVVYSFFEVKIIVEHDITDNILQCCIGVGIDIDEQVRDLTKRYALSDGIVPGPGRV
jgi:hypothetical protein